MNAPLGNVRGQHEVSECLLCGRVVYFEDAAYSVVFVTGDETLARRGRSLRLSSPRILLTEEWVAEALKGRRVGTRTGHPDGADSA